MARRFYSPERREEHRRAIHEAHRAFDVIWKYGLVTRERAYKLLAKELKVSERCAHMSRMRTARAKRVPEAAMRIIFRLVLC